MKRRIFVIAALVLCASLLAFGTLAYFTAQDEAQNIITAGNLDIQVVETDESGDPFENQTGVMPGSVIDKVVKVENIGDNTAWIRVRVTAVCTANGTELPIDGIVLDYNTTDWVYADGFYYYTSPVDAAEFTTALFNTVTFGIGLGNEYQNAQLTIDVEADAVQYANNGATVMEAQGWPAP